MGKANFSYDKQPRRKAAVFVFSYDATKVKKDALDAKIGKIVKNYADINAKVESSKLILIKGKRTIKLRSEWENDQSRLTYGEWSKRICSLARTIKADTKPVEKNLTIIDRYDGTKVSMNI